MKKVLVGMIVLLSVAAMVNAEEAAPAMEPAQAIDGVTTTVDVTYVTKYIWRGFNVYGSHGAMQPSVNFAHESGLSANVWMSYPVGSGEVNGLGINDELTEYDYTLAYSGSIFEDAYQTNYNVGWRYYDYIKAATKDFDAQEVFVEAAMPNIVGNGFVPHAAWYQMWNAKSGGANNSTAPGGIFVMGFGYDFSIEQAPELPMSFTWDLIFNDGAGGVDQDWSHMVFGLSTAVDVPSLGGKLVPAVYWQNSFEDTVNENDELWAGLSFSLDF